MHAHEGEEVLEVLAGEDAVADALEVAVDVHGLLEALPRQVPGAVHSGQHGRDGHLGVLLSVDLSEDVAEDGRPLRGQGAAQAVDQFGVVDQPLGLREVSGQQAEGAAAVGHLLLDGARWQPVQVLAVEDLQPQGQPHQGGGLRLPQGVARPLHGLVRRLRCGGLLSAR